jgi:shikimate kinase
MGTGKTAVGRILAERLNRQFIEIDAVIAETSKKAISDIFKNDGEIAFREMEIAAIKRAAAGGNQVIACGGGAVLNTINIDRLRASGILICLKASPEVILHRTTADGPIRPLINGGQPLARIQELMQFRKPFYYRAADFSINTSKLNIDTVTDKIIARLKNYEGFNL